MHELAFSSAGVPRELPMLGYALAMREDPLRTLCAIARERGGIAPIRLGPARGHLVSEPELLSDVLVKQASRYTRFTPVYRTMAKFLGQGILTSEGEEWRTHRRIVQPAFSRQRLAAFADAIAALTERHAERYQGEIDMSECMMELTLHIVSEVLLSARTERDARDIGEAVAAAQRYTESIISRGFELPSFLPTRRARSFFRAVETLDRVAYGIIDERRGSTDEGHDVVSMLLAARYDDGSPLPRKRIRDELITLLAAGHETTSNALSFTLMRLSQHPDVARRLVAEVDQVLEGRRPTLDDVPKLKLTRRVLDETMRLHPPVWITGRLAKETHELGGRRIDEGSLVLLSPYVTQRRPDLWDNPEGFDPDRWIRLSERGALPPFAFFPFGGGTRKCVGESFAYLEATIVLAMLAQRFDLMLTGRPVVALPQITMGMKHGLWMRVVPRAG